MVSVWWLNDAKAKKSVRLLPFHFTPSPAQSAVTAAITSSVNEFVVATLRGICPADYQGRQDMTKRHSSSI
jgi:hypothetical protein